MSFLGSFGSLLDDPRVQASTAIVAQTNSGGFSLNGLLAPLSVIANGGAKKVPAAPTVKANIPQSVAIPWYVQYKRMLWIGGAVVVGSIIAIAIAKR